MALYFCLQGDSGAAPQASSRATNAFGKTCGWTGAARMACAWSASGLCACSLQLPGGARAHHCMRQPSFDCLRCALRRCGV